MENKKIINDIDENIKESKCFDFDFEIGEKLTNTNLEAIEKTTQPPSRYTEASLIKTLDKLGIGRPSTYATIVTTLLDEKRNYCKIDNKKICPTDLALKLINFLDKNFPDIVDYKYTANLESSLDKIATGKDNRVHFLTDFYSDLEKEISKVTPNVEAKKCPECGGNLIIRKSRYGMFLGCSNYPKCNHIEKINSKN